MVHVIENDEPKFEEASLNITCNPQYQVAPTIRPHQLSAAPPISTLHKHSTLYNTVIRAALITTVAARILRPLPGAWGGTAKPRKYAYKVDFLDTD